MNRTRLAILPVAALVLAGCGGNGDETTTGEPAATLGSPTSETGTEAATDAAGDEATDEATAEGSDGATTTDGPTGATTSGDARFGTPAEVGGPYGELRHGRWEVGPAGEVEFRVTGPDSLELVGATASSGWTLTEQEVDGDEIEVVFRSGDVQYTFEVQMDGGVLEIEIDQDIDPAQPGTFFIGEAATVALSVENGRIVLGEVTLNDGWTETDRSVDDDDVELDFRREGSGFFELWELTADLDDGVLDVEVDYEIEGSFTG